MTQLIARCIKIDVVHFAYVLRHCRPVDLPCLTGKTWSAYLFAVATLEQPSPPLSVSQFLSHVLIGNIIHIIHSKLEVTI